ncbi:MAG: hypothetical protein M3203_10500 [Actinomycetota bacterium]|nr:hypothetical protein [Actinomycetota bacterium]
MPGHAGQPDFAVIYGGEAQLTPRMAAHLWSAALFIADTYREGDQLDLLRRELPPVARRLTDDAWMRRFVSSFDALAGRLASGRFAAEQLASCTAEEMALHLVIDLAEDFAADGTLPRHDDLPAHDGADTDFEWAREVLFRDQDVLLLFNTSFDGIEDDSNELSGEFRFADLHRGTGL